MSDSLKTIAVAPVGQPLWLASASPRRRRMLAPFGLDLKVQVAKLDDGHLNPGDVTPALWVAALAYFKARQVADEIGRADGVILGADTVCVHDGEIFGQPPTEDAARSMLHAMRGQEHVTMTGVCVVDPATRERWFMVDRTRVAWGWIDDREIDTYVASGAWRGKAGGYNLEERIAAGWPIETVGDPDTVMGLPLLRLEPWLRELTRNAPDADRPLHA